MQALIRKMGDAHPVHRLGTCVDASRRRASNASTRPIGCRIFMDEAGIPLVCQRCGRDWQYTGQSNHPRCKCGTTLTVKYKRGPHKKAWTPTWISCASCPNEWWYSGLNPDQIRCSNCKA